MSPLLPATTVPRSLDQLLLARLAGGRLTARADLLAARDAAIRAGRHDLVERAGQQRACAA